MGSEARKLRREVQRKLLEELSLYPILKETPNEKSTTRKEEEVIPKVEITNSSSKSKDNQYIRIKTTEITIPIAIMNSMGIKEKDFILTAVLGDQNFLAKRPSGMFGGDQIVMYQKNENYAPYGRIQVKTTTTKQTVGEFTLGKPFNQHEKNEQGRAVEIMFFPLTAI